MRARRKRHARPASPAVLVTVAGGVAYTCASRGVRVVVVDWDNLTASDSLQVYSSDDIKAIIDELETLPPSILKQAPEMLPDLRQEIDRRKQLKRFVPPGSKIPIGRPEGSQSRHEPSKHGRAGSRRGRPSD